MSRCEILWDCYIFSYRNDKYICLYLHFFRFWQILYNKNKKVTQNLQINSPLKQRNKINMALVNFRAVETTTEFKINNKTEVHLEKMYIWCVHQNLPDPNYLVLYAFAEPVNRPFFCIDINKVKCSHFLPPSGLAKTDKTWN